jgi:hypothetical protein
MGGVPRKELVQFIPGMTDSKKTKLSRRLEDELMRNSSMTRDWKEVRRADQGDSICGTTSGWTMTDCVAYRSRVFFRGRSLVYRVLAVESGLRFKRCGLALRFVIQLSLQRDNATVVKT